MNHNPGLQLVLAGGRNVRLELALKRVLDVVGALGLLIALSPVLLAIAVLVPLTSKGPVFHVCRWVGKDERRFKGLKFRTMLVGAEAMEKEMQAHNEMVGPAFKMTNDPRVT